MKYLKTLIVSLFLAATAEAGKVEQKEGSDMPVMVVMKRRAPHFKNFLNEENRKPTLNTGPKFMMMRGDEDENPIDSLDSISQAAMMGMMPPMSAMALPHPLMGGPPPPFMGGPPPPFMGGPPPSFMGGPPNPYMSGVSSADFLHMSLQTEMMHEIQNVEK